MQRVYTTLVIGFVCFFVAGAHAAAIIAGSAPGAPTVTEHSDFIPDLDSIGGWIVEAAPGVPIEVAADPAAPPWEKMFSGFSSIAGGMGFSIHELLVVAPGSPDWTDWHEEIVTPGWLWGPGAMVTVGGPTGTSYPMSGGGTPLLWTFFPPAPTGSVIEVWKEIICDLPDSCSGSITVIEHPTVPIPAAGWLLAGALVLLARPGRGRFATRSV